MSPLTCAACSFQQPSVEHLSRSSLSIPPWLPSPPPPPSRPSHPFVCLPSSLSVPGLTSRSQRRLVMVTSPDSAPSSSIYAPSLLHSSVSGCALPTLQPSPHLSFYPPLPSSLQHFTPSPTPTPPAISRLWGSDCFSCAENNISQVGRALISPWAVLGTATETLLGNIRVSPR